MSVPAKIASPLRGDLLAMMLVGAWLVIWRAVLGVSWGFAPAPTVDGFLAPGILCNPGDTWSYLSWVQQYRHSSGLAELLYTTEPHQPLLWMFPLWLVGQIAALTGLSVIGVYNAAGFAGALFAVFLFRRAVTALGLPASARDWACFALVLGSGGSWLWHLLAKLGVAPPAQSAETFFLDLFPSTAFVAYAYHAIGLALLAALWWQTTRLESRLFAGTSALTPALCTGALALLLGFSRPYEPVAFFGAWSLKTAWHCLRRRHDPASWRASRSVALLLGAALAPGLGWTAWVASRPVWSTFAGESMSLGLGFGPVAWLVTLGGWIALAAIGLGPAWRADARRAVLPVAATMLLLAVLIILGSGRTKLASGLALGPIVLAGWGIARLLTVGTRSPRFVRPPLASLTIFALLGVPSFFLTMQSILLQPPAQVASGLWSLALELPTATKHPALVLAGPEAGAVLPGLVGAKVWAGHFSLTHRYKEKLARLRVAGLDPERLPSSDTASAAALAAILSEAPFSHAIIQDRCGAALARLLALGWTTARSAEGWTLLRAPLRTASTP